MINFRDLLAFLNPIWHAQQHAGMGLVYLFPSGDTSGAKDYAAISAALSVYQTVVLTDGSYYFNQGITVPCHKSLKGVSQNVVLNFTPITAYTALQITASANTTFSEYGPFQLVSLASVPGSIGVALNGSASVLTTVVYGVTLNRIKTYQFDLGFYARTALHTKMLKCSAFGASGVVIDGQCVDFVADDFYAYLQAAVFGATPTINGGVKTGIVVQSYNYGAAGTQRPEDVHFNHPQVLGAAKGINWITCLYGSLFAPVMDYITDIGIYVGNYDGGLQIKNLYVGLSGTSAEYGLLSEYKAAAPAGYLDIDGAAFEAYTNTALASASGGASAAIWIKNKNDTTRIRSVCVGLNSGSNKYSRGVWLDHCDDSIIDGVKVANAAIANAGEYLVNTNATNVIPRGVYGV